jgi:hypothetical protein
LHIAAGQSAYTREQLDRELEVQRIQLQVGQRIFVTGRVAHIALELCNDRGIGLPIRGPDANEDASFRAQLFHVVRRRPFRVNAQSQQLRVPPWKNFNLGQ